MGCPAEVEIGENLVFSICTHDPTSGELTDADSPPVYRIYEEETATPVATGTMSKLDDANTSGFYTELIACTALLGYGAGKSYTIYIEAQVAAYVGGITFGFKISGNGGKIDVVDSNLDAVLAKLLEIYELYGLDPTKPLVVSRTSRTAGSIVQSISTVSEVTTVRRT